MLCVLPIKKYWKLLSVQYMEQASFAVGKQNRLLVSLKLIHHHDRVSVRYRVHFISSPVASRSASVWEEQIFSSAVCAGRRMLRGCRAQPWEELHIMGHRCFSCAQGLCLVVTAEKTLLLKMSHMCEVKAMRCIPETVGTAGKSLSNQEFRHLLLNMA